MNAVLSTSTSSQSSSLRPLLLNTAVPPHPPRHTPLPTALHLASSPALLLVRQIVCDNQLNRYESMHCICETPFPLFNYELLPSSNCATALMFELFIHRSDWHSNKPLTIHDSVATFTVVFYGQQKCEWLTFSQIFRSTEMPHSDRNGENENLTESFVKRKPKLADCLRSADYTRKAVSDDIRSAVSDPDVP